jgi:hypothetical protein
MVNMRGRLTVNGVKTFCKKWRQFKASLFYLDEQKKAAIKIKKIVFY